MLFKNIKLKNKCLRTDFLFQNGGLSDEKFQFLMKINLRKFKKPYKKILLSLCTLLYESKAYKSRRKPIQ